MPPSKGKAGKVSPIGDSSQGVRDHAGGAVNVSGKSVDEIYKKEAKERQKAGQVKGHRNALGEACGPRIFGSGPLGPSAAAEIK